ncbi:alpha/beta hydrolase fold domain-containing protein [uncultured Microbulbifer sp.]|uniref:alpha/beta hydrolase fold domain-containing protein n=1 Tax=uncultured Microbulbifer sp. TaxID=348147 RepID=UPI00344BF234
MRSWRGSIRSAFPRATKTRGLIDTKRPGESCQWKSLQIRWYNKAGSIADSALVYLHDGGFILGDVEYLLSRWDIAKRQSTPPSLLPFEDYYSALNWLSKNAESQGVNPKRLTVIGDSTGGGRR